MDDVRAGVWRPAVGIETRLVAYRARVGDDATGVGCFLPPCSFHRLCSIFRAPAPPVSRVYIPGNTKDVGVSVETQRKGERPADAGKVRKCWTNDAVVYLGLRDSWTDGLPRNRGVSRH
ncbi:hypothetical protein CGRA01v4_00474 [Colletotrichum graminicola]|nr:hypothetical protein CGRA01v4_00474 [Colletotrichum graminicola]